MAEESKRPRPGVYGFLDELKVELRKKTVSGLAVAILSAAGTIGILLLGAIAYGWVSLPDPWVWGLRGALVLALLLLAVLLSRVAFKRGHGAWRPTEPAAPAMNAEGPTVSPGLRIEHEDGTFGNVLGFNCHLKRYFLRIERAAFGVRFVCRYPLHHVVQRLTEEVGTYKGEPRVSRPRAEWADILFPDNQAARGALLTVELSSKQPIIVQEIELLATPLADPLLPTASGPVPPS